MKTLIIYDSTGKIFNMVTGDYSVPTGLTYLEVEIPDGKMVKSVDVSVTPNLPVYENIPIQPIVKLQEDLQKQIVINNLQSSLFYAQTNAMLARIENLEGGK